MKPTFKQRLHNNQAVLAPGVYDGLTAMLVAEAGFPAAYLSGASLAYTRFGFPDIGLPENQESRLFWFSWLY